MCLPLPELSFYVIIKALTFCMKRLYSKCLSKKASHFSSGIKVIIKKIKKTNILTNPVFTMYTIFFIYNNIYKVYFTFIE